MFLCSCIHSFKHFLYSLSKYKSLAMYITEQIFFCCCFYMIWVDALCAIISSVLKCREKKQQQQQKHLQSLVCLADVQQIVHVTRKHANFDGLSMTTKGCFAIEHGFLQSLMYSFALSHEINFQYKLMVNKVENGK